MRYISTRGEAPTLGFSDTVLTGLAPDGGLYVPEKWPAFSTDDMIAMGGMTYAELARTVISRFVGSEDIVAQPGPNGRPVLEGIVEETYRAFRHPAVAPLKQLGSNLFLMELFHGPTLAFKDIALQFLARLMDHILAERGERATIIGATSGDTGGAAIEAFRGRERVEIAILFPDGRVSAVQRRQMTTPCDANVRAIAIEGNFDDAQALVKSLFNDNEFRQRMRLSGVNSINWGRIVAQIVYYFAAATSLGAPHRPISFTVPTGNFGNIFAGYAAKKMGLPIDRLVIATNVNDILHRTLQSGRYETRQVCQTMSPSMDIQVSSNFERFLFDCEGRDAAAVRGQMAGLAQSGSFGLDERCLAQLRDTFSSDVCDENQTRHAMAKTYRETGEIVDPHTAVGLAVAEGRRERSVPMIALATAHPAKFPEAVSAATGHRPELPEWCGDLLTRTERYQVLPAELDRVREFIGQGSGQREKMPEKAS